MHIPPSENLSIRHDRDMSSPLILTFLERQIVFFDLDISVALSSLFNLILVVVMFNRIFELILFFLMATPTSCAHRQSVKPTNANHLLVFLPLLLRSVRRPTRQVLLSVDYRDIPMMIAYVAVRAALLEFLEEVAAQ
ncbi:hypothetical protein QR680_018697 [Steinernema hermaphroditum]|uniref:Uncharacterized protein n=1 Tax=Steinernema hermaphroditum TaxID=289476 RepID=A0AA39HIR7_9BILA|nr:hypothetical protein QR680_018697 [Steinernema hermaphroditum]